jgi:hypothetical protein
MTDSFAFRLHARVLTLELWILPCAALVNYTACYVTAPDVTPIEYRMFRLRQGSGKLSLHGLGNTHTLQTYKYVGDGWYPPSSTLYLAGWLLVDVES